MRTILMDGLNVKVGGGVTIFVRIAIGFASAGWRVHVLIVSERVAKLLNETHVENMTIHLRPELQKTAAALYFRHRKFDALAKSLGSDLVFSLNYWTPCSIPQVTYFVNITPFLSYRRRVQSGLDPIRTLIQPYYSRAALRRSNLKVFESHYLAKIAGGSFAGTIENQAVRYIGIDIPESVKPVDSVALTLIAVTSGAHHKRNDLLLELHKKVSAEHAGLVNLVIGGGGQETTIRERLSDEDNNYIEAHSEITFLGYCTREELYAELAGATVLVSFSELESFFMVPLEAMSVGCPVIISNTTSAEESVGEAGILVAHEDTDKAAEWVLKLFDKKCRESYSRKSIAWAEQFRAEDCVDAFVNLVETM